MNNKNINHEQQHVINLLEQLGLTNEQAKIFLILFENGHKTVPQLAKITNWGRNKIYRIVSELQKLNLVTEKPKSFGTSYVALGLNELKSLVTKKQKQYEKAQNSLKELVKTLPYLKSASNVASTVIHYKGIDGLKQVNWNLVHAKDMYRVYEVSRLSDYLEKDFAEKLRLEWLRRKIRARDLTNDKEIPDHTNVVEYTTKLSEYRYIDPKILKIDTEIYIYNDIVAILEYDSLKYDPNSIFCVEIHNQALANFQKQIYDIIWNMAKSMKIISKNGARVVEE